PQARQKVYARRLMISEDVYLPSINSQMRTLLRGFEQKEFCRPDNSNFSLAGRNRSRIRQPGFLLLETSVSLQKFSSPPDPEPGGDPPDLGKEPGLSPGEYRGRDLQALLDFMVVNPLDKKHCP